jgi:hypothetical protein
MTQITERRRQRSPPKYPKSTGRREIYVQQNKSIHSPPPDSEADQKDDEPLTLPLIAISRDPNLNISVSTKRNLTFDGKKLDGSSLQSIQLDAIPIDLNYQIDIYTQKYDEGDEYLRNFIFNFVNYPQMKVLLPYNGSNIEHVCYIRLSNTATDNSDVSEKLFADQFTR